MKRNATKSVPLGGAFWDAGAEVQEYEQRAVPELGAECARWLANGAR